ncbi:MinD/ParA family protein [Alphaproteobacteria bacterium]|jgi:flagellar biosynthesis protein FlhG|nr:MinD/ParA family protein [Alphaproteobacteria bacterium]MDB2497772.1 MinD/ParA family protein [Alphaproteobacteria bacterium]
MATTIAVTSGKGGVGKTNTAVNLATTMCRLGKRVILFDADFGLANAHVLLGTNPKATIADFLAGTASMAEVITPGPLGLKFVSGGSGLIELLNLDNQARYRTVAGLSSLQSEVDYLIVDCPAGASDSTLFFVNAVDIALVVLVAEPTSFLDAYAMLKAAYLEKNIAEFSIMVNMAENSKTAEANFKKFRDIAMRFLDVKLHYAGMIPQSTAIRQSIIKRKPISVSQPKSSLAENYESLARRLMKTQKSTHDAVKFFDGAS